MMEEAIQELKIDKSDWTPVKFGDVVCEPKENAKDIYNEGIEHVVGLEHIDTENIHLTRSGKLEESTTFSKKFSEGDVLFGRRRAYLKKAAQASFSGICSGDITVFRAKENLMPELLPFIVCNDKFFDYAVKHSAGGLSPRVKFKDLANYEFLLPPKDQQAQLAELLWAMDEVIEGERMLFDKTQALLEAARRKMNQGNLEVFIGDQITDLITKGASPKWQGFDYCNEGTLFVTSENVLEDSIDLKEKKFLPLAFNYKQKRSQLMKGDILINIVGASIGRLAIFNEEFETVNINQAVCLFRVNNTVVPEYIVNYLLEESNKDRLLNNQSATARPNLSLKNLSDFKFYLPSKSEQRKRMEKISKIKDSLNNTKSQISSSQSLKKSLINQIF
ncbi:restriction endonuclease subunit S [Marinoscillum sp.]|uniref:restriction endonuclease subunit S n=1 Tax=Marinoscillum sp. TaxID=2024838 RepID=UPI003BAB2747